MIEHSLKDWILVGVLTIGSGAALGYYIWSALEGWTAVRWPTAPGEIISSAVEDVPGRLPSYEPKVSYSYSVGGVTRTGNRLRFGDNTVSFEATARKRLASYPRGTAIQVHYDPEDPERSVLRPGVSRWNYAFMVLAGAMFLAGLALLTGVAR